MSIVLETIIHNKSTPKIKAFEQKIEINHFSGKMGGFNVERARI
jgi:hypothetical protein